MEVIEKILREEDGYKLGEVWKFSENSVGAVVPIIRHDAPDRVYTTLPETEDVDLKDTGSIGGVKVSGIDKPLFIRSGSMLGGQGTQSRTTEHSEVVMPNVEKDLRTKCIHQSHGIRKESGFVYEGTVPKETIKAARSGSQHAVWSSVNSFVGRAAGGQSMGFTGAVGAGAETVSRDDLVGVKKTARKMGSRMQDVLKEVPCFENQVGAIIVSMTGIEGIELFDHPDSWVGQYKDVIENYENLAEESSALFRLDDNMVMEKVREFLENLKSATVKPVEETSEYGVYYLTMDNYIGEMTKLAGETIHLFIFESEPEEDMQMQTRRRVGSGIRQTQDHFIGGVTMPENHDNDVLRDPHVSDLFRNNIQKKKGFDDILKALHNGEKNFKSIHQSTGVSEATLSTRLKEGQKYGFISKDNDKKYKLTGFGKNVVESLNENKR